MAWEKTHKIKIRDMSKTQIWKVWEDVNQWHLWDTDIEFAKLDQPFAVGSTFLLKPKAGPKVKIKIEQMEKGKTFTDVTAFPLAKMYGIHHMSDTSDGLEVSHTVRIEGPLSFLWRKIVAEKVASGLEEQASKMVERARQIKAHG